MKRKLLASSLSLVLALSMLTSTAFASAVTIWNDGDVSGEGVVYEEFNDDAKSALANADSTAYAKLGEDQTISIENGGDEYPVIYGLAFSGSTFDMDGHTLTFVYDGPVGNESDLGWSDEGIDLTYTGLYVIGDGVSDDANVIKNGEIILQNSDDNNSSEDEQNLHAVYVTGASQTDLNDMDITIDESAPADSAIGVFFYTDDGEVVLDNCNINAGKDAEIVKIKDIIADDPYSTSGNGKVNIVSGVFSSDPTKPSDERLEISSPDDSHVFSNIEDSKAEGYVVTSANTAAVIVGKDGKATLYNDLTEAVEKSGDQPVTVLKTDDVANLDIKADTTLNLVAGNGVEGLDKAIEDALAKSTSNAAYVKGGDGKYHTYSDLSKAMEASKGAPVVVTDESALEKLEVKAGDKLNLVDASGKTLNDKVNLGDKLILNPDGTVAAKPAEPVGPIVGPVEPIGPIEPIGPGEIEIDDPDTPLAGFPITLAPTDKLTRGMLMFILHWMDEAPAAELASFIDVAADSDYAEAIGWASANGIANGVGADKFAPEDFVTRGQLVTFLNRYAAYVGSDVTVELNGDANEIMTWAVAEEIINDFFARLYA